MTNFKESQQISTKSGFTQHYFLSERESSAGFTLIELVAVISVMVIISGVLLVNYTRFGNSVLLTNLAYDISLSIRQAQQFGTAVRGTGTTFNTGYGVRFTSGDPTHYTLFADLDRTQTYSAGDEDIENYSIRRGRILFFCGFTTIATWECSPSISYLDIVFDRPRAGSISNAFISSDSPSTYTIGLILVTDAGGNSTRYIAVWDTGQISVQ